MQVIVKNLFRLFLCGMPVYGLAQSANLPQGSPYHHFLERVQLKLQRHNGMNLENNFPLSRRSVTRYAQLADSLQQAGSNLWSEVDRQYLRRIFRDHTEWYSGPTDSLTNQKGLWKTFYLNPVHFLEVNQKDFYFTVDPVLQQQQSLASDESERIFLNTRGAAFRGMVARRLGFSGYLTDNLERGPEFFRMRVDSFRAVPGAGWNKPFRQTARDYFDGRGSIHFNALRYIDFQFGYDKSHIGTGHRSLFLSDFGNSYLFLKVNTRIWKLNYLNQFMELTPQFYRNPNQDVVFDKKYAAIHHLSVNVRPWLNLGLFEGVIFARKNRFDFTYLNPVILLRLAEQQNGSGDNAFLGLDFKANVARRAQFYGQFLFDEFVLKELRDQTGWWANKYAVQLGAKYLDLFSVKNLDLQAEMNMARPFTYSHHDSLTNYTHYNQPLAHPLGANFIEFIGIIRYQPQYRWTASLRWIAWKQGVDSSGTFSNVGSNIFKLSFPRSLGDYGYHVGSGILQRGMNLQLLLSYEWKPNLFVEGAALVRKVSKPAGVTAVPDVMMVTLGLRWNMFRREYDY